MKSSTTYLKIVGIAAASFYLISCTEETVEQQLPDENAMHARYDLALNDKLDVFEKLEKPTSYPVDLVVLGRTLYNDKRLSKNETISCNSCHDLSTFGVDNKPTSTGDDGRNGDRNSPTVLNAALHSSQFWDGRAADVQEQAGMPIMNPIEMGIPSEAYLENKLRGIEEYRMLFSKAFPESSNPITYDNLKTAIAEFEKQLITPSRFDEYLSGDKEALSLKEKQGLVLFTGLKCTQCHNGVAIGGNSLQKFGVHQDYWELTGSKNIDKGRFAVTGEPTDMYQFKTPSLRNVAETGPYFHDGSVSNLQDAIRIMGKAQLNIDLKQDDVEKIEAFLKTLTGN